VAELFRAEKELSDWFPGRPEFSYTDRYDGLAKSCFAKFLEKNSKPCVLAFLPIILAKTSAKMTFCESFVNFFRLCSALINRNRLCCSQINPLLN